MSKGSGRRPTFVSDAEAQANYDCVFQGRDVPEPVICSSVYTTYAEVRVRCQNLGTHFTHQAELDGEMYRWVDEPQKTVPEES